MTGAIAEADLPDGNVWLALAIREHQHHEVAARYRTQSAAAQLWFCRVTMPGLVRLLTQPWLVGAATVTLSQAHEICRRFVALPEAGLLVEPAGCEAAMASLLETGLPARFCTDACLAAFAIAGGLRLVSFDRDFDRVPSLTRLHLTP